MRAAAQTAASAALDVARRLALPGFWLVLALALIGGVAAYQVRHPSAVDVGTPGDAPYLRNFLPRIDTDPDGRTYRTSDSYSYAILPGLGGGVPYSVTVSLHPGRADLPLAVLINGDLFQDRPLPDGWQTLTFAVDATHPAALAARGVVVEFRAPAGRRILLDRVDVGPAGPGFVVPAFDQLAALAALVALGYLLLWRVFSFSPQRRKDAKDLRVYFVFVGTGLIALGLIGLLAEARLAFAAWSGAAVAGMVGLHLGLGALRWVGRRLAPEVGRARELLGYAPLWGLVALVLAGVTAAHQVRHAYTIDLGAPTDQAYVRNFQDRTAEEGSTRTFRPSGTYSYLVLPGVGGGVPYSLTITLKPREASAPLTAIVNGDPFVQRTVSGDWQTITLDVDATHPRALASRDLVIELRTVAAFGLLVDGVTVGAAGPGFVAPAYSQLAYGGALVVLVYLLIGRALGAERGVRRVALAGAAGAGALLVAGVAALHLPVTAATSHLVTTGMATYLVLVGAEALARRIAPEAGAVGARWAGGLVAGAFLLRFGLMALPQAVIIDLPYHMKWMRELLAGNLAALTDPRGGLNAPPREWGLAVLIPKSPLFYFVAAPLAALPGELDVWMRGLVCLLEASTALFCYGLAARFAPGGWRAGLWAGFVYAANPLGYRALAYGILPTILAQWLTVAFFALLLLSFSPQRREDAKVFEGDLAGRRRGLRWAQYGLLFLLLAMGLVAFPTIAVFTTLVVGGLVVSAAWARDWRRVGALAGLGVAAWVAAIGVYYAPYLVDLVTRTVPQLLAGSGSGGGGSASTVHWTGPLDLLAWTFDYLTSPLPLLLGLAGLATLWLGARRVGPGLGLGTLTGWWMLVLPVFLVANYRFDMIGKHLFYTMVPLALGSGIALWRLAQRGRLAGLFAALLAATLAWQAVVFWVERLWRAST